MSETWLLNPESGDYVVDDQGKPVIDNSLKVPAYIRLRAPRTQWMYAPDVNYGSDFYQGKLKHNPESRKTVELIAQRALQALMTDGRARQIIVDTVTQSRFSLGFRTVILDIQGQRDDFSITPILG